MKNTHKAQDIAITNTAMTKLNAAFQSASQDIYNAASGNAGNAATNQSSGSSSPSSAPTSKSDTTDVNFEEVK